MAILDWPTGDEFKPMQPLTLGYSTPKSAFVGAYTGERQAATRAADRMVMEMVLPPCRGVAARRRAAWLASLASTGDWVRMPAWSQRYPGGTIAGAPTVNGAVAAGARSVTLAGVRGVNLAFNGSFEVDTNADGVADSWTANQAGSVSSVVYSRPTGSAESGTYEQQITWTQGAAGIANRVGIEQLLTNIPAGLSNVTAAVQARSGSGGLVKTVLYCEFRNSALTIIGTGTAVDVAVSTSARIGGTLAVPTGTAAITYHLWAYATSTGAMSVAWDVAMLKQGATDLVTVPGGSLLAGDVIGIGGNLLMVGPTDCAANDTGDVIVPLVAGAPRAISNGAAVTFMAPTGVWQLDTLEAPPAEWGAVQAAVSLIWRQVAQ